MASEAEHRARAAQALAAAECLRPEHSAWALVPLFYSAMHLMHARFDYDALPNDQRHPDIHRGKYVDGVRKAWGTLDVVADRYGAISATYKSLFDAGHAIRYDYLPTLRDDRRFWDDHGRIADFVGRS